ncbi:hypothetical protein [Lysobacter hankyongensis]|uniref:Surface antigen domain-containing protein n=1 Tax=Lysobacter hankyongensis TaxID=1176535 RepID=A0ABP9BZG9_9GAMM
MRFANGITLSFALMAVAATALTACATMPNDRRPLTSEQKIIRCVAMVAGGAALAKALGGDARDGALVGAASCGVWLLFNNKRDKKYIADASLNAMKTGQPQRAEWRGDDGRGRAVNVTFDGTMQPSASYKSAKDTGIYCRTLNVQVQADGSRADTSQDVWCRTADGNFVPRNQLSV